MFSLLPSQQSAYRAYHSTETAVLGLHNDLVRSIDDGQLSMLVLLDLSAAFDTVDHDILLTILSNRFSVEGTALKWFESYLTGRSQTFIYAGNQTSSFSVDCSVPQGSVMGPLCFVSYTEEVTDLFDQHDDMLMILSYMQVARPRRSTRSEVACQAARLMFLHGAHLVIYS